MQQFGFNSSAKDSQFRTIDPLGYFDFLALQMHARFVLTDSGGVQEESTYFNVPCLTLRENTERPITITEGTNILVGTDTDKIIHESMEIINGKEKQGRIPELWDDRVSARIVDILK